jgi:hypothetical protein
MQAQEILQENSCVVCFASPDELVEKVKFYQESKKRYTALKLSR